MKKLIIAAAAVCAAVVAQAASVNWTMQNDGNKTYGYNSVLMILDTNTSAVQDILDNGGATVLADLAGYNINNGGVVGLGKKGDGDGVADNAASGQNYRWVVIKSTDGTAADGTDYTISSAMSYADLDKAGAIAEGEKIATPYAIVTSGRDLFKGDGTISGTIGAAPEPTSAMLLLLGVAGLALKRRRA